MNSVLYNMMCVIITAMVSVLFLHCTKQRRFLAHHSIIGLMDISYIVLFFICSVVLIQALQQEDQTIGSSFWTLVYAGGCLLGCFLALFLLVCLKRKWKLSVPGFIPCLQCFLLLYIILGHILPSICAIWLTMPLKELQGSDLLLLLALCLAGLLLSMLHLYSNQKAEIGFHDRLTKE